MSRPARYIIPAILLSVSLPFTGCKTIYSDSYSPRRNHFIPVKEKPKPEPIAPVIEATPPPAGGELGLPPVAPSSAPVAPAMPDGGAPAIPGL